MQGTNDKGFVSFETQNLMERFRKSLRNAYEKSDMTLETVSEIAEVSVDTLKKMLYGHSQDCYFTNACKIAKSLRCSIDILIGVREGRYTITNGFMVRGKDERITLSFEIK